MTMQDFDTRYNQPGGGFVSGLLFGAAVGAALGVIFAPRAGSDTRRQIAESGKTLRDGAVRTYEQAREGANSAVSKARGAYDRGREAFDRTRREAENTVSDAADQASDVLSGGGFPRA
jgi:gas vesicle protein